MFIYGAPFIFKHNKTILHIIEFHKVSQIIISFKKFILHFLPGHKQNLSKHFLNQ